MTYPHNNDIVGYPYQMTKTKQSISKLCNRLETFEPPGYIIDPSLF